MLPQEKWRMLESGLSLTDPIAQTSNRKSKAERLTWSARVSLQIPCLGEQGEHAAPGMQAWTCQGIWGCHFPVHSEGQSWICLWHGWMGLKSTSNTLEKD